MENQIKNISQLRKKKLDLKTEEIQRQATEAHKNNQILLKKTEYIYNNLLNWSKDRVKNKINKKKGSFTSKFRKKGLFKEGSTLKSVDQDLNISKFDVSQQENLKKNGTLELQIKKEGSMKSLMEKFKTLKRGYTGKSTPDIKSQKKIEIDDSKEATEKDPILV